MPISKSVGSGGLNFRSDVLHVQATLIINRRAEGLPPIALDGIVGPETIGAIKQLQRARSLVVDGRVDPGGPTIKSLELDVFSKAEAQLRADVLACLQPARDLIPQLAMLPYVKLDVGSIIKAAYDLSAGGSSAVQPILAFAPTRRPAMFAVAAAAPAAAAAAVEAMILALIATMALLILIAALPTLGKGAEDLIRKIQILLAELVDGISDAIESIEDLVRRNTRAGMLCSEALIAFRTISKQLLDALRAPRDPDPIKQEQNVFRISNLFQKWKAAFEAVLACLLANGAA